jgi:hypothetical protein
MFAWSTSTHLNIIDTYFNIIWIILLINKLVSYYPPFLREVFLMCTQDVLGVTAWPQIDWLQCGWNVGGEEGKMLPGQLFIASNHCATPMGKSAASVLFRSCALGGLFQHYVVPACRGTACRTSPQPSVKRSACLHIGMRMCGWGEKGWAVEENLTCIQVPQYLSQCTPGPAMSLKRTSAEVGHANTNTLHCAATDTCVCALIEGVRAVEGNVGIDIATIEPKPTWVMFDKVSATSGKLHLSFRVFLHLIAEIRSDCRAAGSAQRTGSPDM